MSLSDLIALYLLIGVSCGAVVMWRAQPPRLHAAPSAMAAVVVWPLWVPFALSSGGDTADQEPASLAGHPHPLASRIRAALGDVRAADSAGMLSEADAEAIEGAVARTLARLTAMDEQLQRRSGERARLASRIDELQQSGREPRALAMAQRHAGALDSLAQLKEREERALIELADVIELMNAQLALSCFDESTSIEELRAELWTRIDALHEASTITAQAVACTAVAAAAPLAAEAPAPTSARRLGSTTSS